MGILSFCQEISHHSGGAVFPALGRNDPPGSARFCGIQLSMSIVIDFALRLDLRRSKKRCLGSPLFPEVFRGLSRVVSGFAPQGKYRTSGNRR
jgi:hypothetical protein